MMTTNNVSQIRIIVSNISPSQTLSNIMGQNYKMQKIDPSETRIMRILFHYIKISIHVNKKGKISSKNKTGEVMKECNKRRFQWNSTQ